MNRYAILVAGGTGTRMNSIVPKQFLLLGDKPILMHSIQKFFDFDPEIKLILVLPEDQHDNWEQLCYKHNFSLNHLIVDGGETRFHSVKNGLSNIEGEGIVAVHDGVRPLVSIGTIRSAFETAARFGNAVPAVAIKDSIRFIEGENNQMKDRSQFKLIQTPQCFNVGILRKAFNQEYKSSFTDEASVVENMGEKIFLIDGNPENIKITSPEDLLIANALYKKQT